MKDQFQDVSAGPREFLNYLRHAHFVVTNSFHGTVFSLLFQKTFYSVYKTGSNDRIQDLLDTLGLGERHLEYQLPEQEPTLFWEEVEDKLQKMRAASYEFLEQALS